MIRFLLILVLVYVVAGALRRFIGGLMAGMDGQAARRNIPATNLVRDPVCGTFVVPSKALSATKGSELRFFCSEKCRTSWVAR
jgi:YHS domain-containing protein